MNNIEIRPAELSDLDDGLVELLDADLTLEQAYVILGTMRGTTYVATCGREILGTAVLFINQKLTHRTAHIEDVVVLEENRGNGIGTKIIEYLVEEAARRRCTKVSLLCADDLIPFYEKCGFERSSSGMKKNLINF